MHLIIPNSYAPTPSELSCKGLIRYIIIKVVFFLLSSFWWYKVTSDIQTSHCTTLATDYYISIYCMAEKLISCFYRQHRGSNPGPLACGFNALHTGHAAPPVPVIVLLCLQCNLNLNLTLTFRQITRPEIRCFDIILSTHYILLPLQLRCISIALVDMDIIITRQLPFPSISRS